MDDHVVAALVQRMFPGELSDGEAGVMRWRLLARVALPPKFALNPMIAISVASHGGRYLAACGEDDAREPVRR